MLMQTLPCSLWCDTGMAFVCRIYTQDGLLDTRSAHCFERSFALHDTAGYQQQPEAKQCIDEAAASCKGIHDGAGAASTHLTPLKKGTDAAYQRADDPALCSMQHLQCCCGL